MSDVTAADDAIVVSGGSLVRFTSTRRELVEAVSAGEGSGLAVACGLVAGASRHRSILRVRRSGFRRIDLWSGDQGLCAHNYVNDPEVPVSGASALVPFQEPYFAALVGNLLGTLPSSVPTASMTMDPEALRDVTRLPDGVDQLIACWDGGGGPERVVAASTRSGCCVAVFEQLGPTVELEGCSAAELWSILRDQVVP